MYVQQLVQQEPDLGISLLEEASVQIRYLPRQSTIKCNRSLLLLHFWCWSHPSSSFWRWKASRATHFKVSPQHPKAQLVGQACRREAGRVPASFMSSESALGWEGPSGSSDSTPHHGQGHLPRGQVAQSLSSLLGTADEGTSPPLQQTAAAGFGAHCFNGGEKKAKGGV